MAGRANDGRTGAARAAALAAVSKLPEPPKGLNKKERDIFVALAKSLPPEKWTPALVMTAAQIAKGFTKLAELDRELRKQGPTVIAQSGQFAGLAVPNPMLRARLEQERQISALMRQCGLSLYGKAAGSDVAAANAKVAAGTADALAPFASLLGMEPRAN